VQESAAAVDELGLAIAIDVGDQRHFLLHVRDNVELVPAPWLPFRIDEEVQRRTDPSHVRHVGPAIAREVGREGLHAVTRVLGRRIDGLCRVDLPGLRKVGTEVVVRTGRDVVHPIVIEIADRSAPGIEHVVDALQAVVR